MFEDSNASKEMYNLEQDPYQLHNLIIQDDQVQNQEEEFGFTTVNASWYINRLQELKNCKGHVDCNVNDVLNSPASISSRNISNSNEEVRIYYNVEINVNWSTDFLSIYLAPKGMKYRYRQGDFIIMGKNQERIEQKWKTSRKYDKFLIALNRFEFLKAQVLTAKYKT